MPNDPGPPKNGTGDTTRTALLSSATDLFSLYGFDGTTVDISKRAVQYDYLTTDQDLADFCRASADASTIAFDTEFVSRTRTGRNYV